MAYRWLVLRVLALTGLGASVALAADQLSGADAFCKFDGPCSDVAASPYSHVLGVPLSVIGALGFGLLFGLSLAPGGWAWSVIRVLAVCAGAAGAALLGIQLFVLGQVCPLCAVADTAALGLAVTALASRPEPARPSWPRLAGWLAAAFLAVCGPTFWSLAHVRPPVPDEVRAHWVPGRVTVVEVTDFDCPHCQRADAVLREVLSRHPDVRLVRLPAPMPQHEHARPAARAFLAAARQGKGEAMAAALFAADSRDPAACRSLAAGLGLDLAAYDRAVRDPAADAELDRTLEWARGWGTGLPLVWVQERSLGGALKLKELDEAIRQATETRPTSPGPASAPGGSIPEASGR